MARKAKTAKSEKQVDALKHDKATRKNLATAELASIAERMEESDPVAPVRLRRNTPLEKGETRSREPDLDPQIIWNGARIRLSREQACQLQEDGEVEIGDAQLVWRGKDRQDWSDLVVQAPQLYIQEKIHPKAIIADLIRRSKQTAAEKDDSPDLFADFNGLDDPEARLEFYQHDQHWSNRMILGDSLHVMASLAGARTPARAGAVHLYRPALWHSIQFQSAGLDAIARSEGWPPGGCEPRAGTSKGLSRHLEGRHSLIPYLFA
jgi:adenine-specific DNA-methyltransferase